MLRLQNLTKTYPHTAAPVLQNLCASFSSGELVAILGESGCGKTTLLQILGGLDRDYTGKLFVNGRDAATFTDAHWDACHGREIGFVLQQYALLSTHTVLENVLLSLQFAAIPRSRQKKAALHALQQVGMLSFCHTPVRKLSGGQQQRVAIARAIAPNPSILLCDEPTGALDPANAEEIMRLLRTLTKNRLILMVTHNTALANRYATRVLHLHGGRITQDTAPAVSSDKPVSVLPKKPLPLLTALSVSFGTFRRKKLRTALQTLAGALSLLGIFFVLALSGGTKTYLTQLEQQVLHLFPLRVQTDSFSTDALFSLSSAAVSPPAEGQVGIQPALSPALQTAPAQKNDVAALARYVTAHADDFSALCTQIEEHFGESWQVYTICAEPVMLYPQAPLSAKSLFAGRENSMEALFASQLQSFALLPEPEEILQTYHVRFGRLPQSWQDVVLVVDENGNVPDYALCMLGLYSVAQLQNGEIPASLPAQELLGLEFGFVSTAQTYTRQSGLFTGMSAQELSSFLQQQEHLRVVGILQPTGKATLPGGCIGYTASLPAHALTCAAQSEAVQAQQNSPYVSIFTGQPFSDVLEQLTGLNADTAEAFLSALPADLQQKYRSFWEQAQQMQLTEEQLRALAQQALAALGTQESYLQNLSLLGAGSVEAPVSLLFYPRDFAAKEDLCALLHAYNEAHPDTPVSYTDSAAGILQSLDAGVRTVKTVLFAFGAISLLVGACMTGVLGVSAVTERRQEIGLMRTLGASRKDIRRLFRLENIWTGAAAGVAGVGLGLLLCPAGNAALRYLTGAKTLLRPDAGGLLLLCTVSILLSVVAGAIPAQLAAKKDPAQTLREM